CTPWVGQLKAMRMPSSVGTGSGSQSPPHSPHVRYASSSGPKLSSMSASLRLSVRPLDLDSVGGSFEGGDPFAVPDWMDDDAHQRLHDRATTCERPFLAVPPGTNVRDAHLLGEWVSG